MRKIPVLFLFLFVLLATGACRRGQPNVVLITFDTTRADHIGYAIGREGLTPNLDRLAAGGTWFSTAVAVQPLTAPSHGSILTGRYPFHHGLRNNGGYVLGEESVTITERLKQAGYATHAIVSSFVLDSQFGFDQGFDSYDDDLRGSKISAKFMFREIPADRVADKALAWLNEKRPKEQPFFLWLHFYDPHADWAPPKEIAAKFPDDPYSGEIHFADQQLGRVLDRIGEFGLHDDTLYVFTADHGESLGDHGEKTHGIFIYDATTRVPLFLRGPGVPEGRVDAVVRSVDIVPTLAELLDLPAGGDVDGASLVSLMKGKEEAEGRIAYSESFAPL
ncbi:MAG TPA: sulfatase, partial [Thermoanaerobaculia bacterium]|nr:sulfatase [Thermoanaerobaculia bacterium]